MKHIKKSTFLLLVSVITTINSLAQNVTSENNGFFKPTVESLSQYKCPEWFNDAKFGIWSHWGPQSVPMRYNGWYARQMYEEGSPTYKYNVATYGHPSKFGYKDIIPLWKAEKFDPEQLMLLYKAAGAKYFVALANHHDNFDLWDSKYQPRWNSVNMGPHKNIVKLWHDAAIKAGLRFGVTQHLERTWSWFQTNKGADKEGPYAGIPYDGNDTAYQDLYLKPDPQGDNNKKHPLNAPEEWRKHWLARSEDLIEKYHPDLMYVDSAIPFAGDDKGQTGLEMISYLYNTSMKKHNGKNEAVMCVKKLSDHGIYWEGITTLDKERTRLGDISAVPWQQDNSTGPWFYNLDWKDNETGTMYYSARKIISELVDVVSKNGTMLLNVTQRPDGSLDSIAIQRLKEIGAWMKINGEAIYSTRPWKKFGETKDDKFQNVNTETKDLQGSKSDEILKYSYEDIRFTQSKDGKILHALVMSWPTSGMLVIRSLSSPSVKIESVSLLGYKGKIKWTQTSDGRMLTMPDKKPCDYVFAFKISGKGICEFKNQC